MLLGGSAIQVPLTQVQTLPTLSSSFSLLVLKIALANVLRPVCFLYSYNFNT